MSRLGLPVPPGFVITTTTCLDFFEAKGKMPASLKDDYLAALAKVEKQAGKKFGDKSNPLLLSVRSGAAVSMPGMMDTVLSLGLNDEIAAALVEATGNKKWVFDCYRRLIQMYQNVVLGKSTEPYEEVIKKTKTAKGYKHDMELSGEDWEAVVAEFKVLSDGGLPSDPHEQLETAIAAVFNSWFTPRAVRYREYNNIEGLLGTACNVQTMVRDRGGRGGREGGECMCVFAAWLSLAYSPSSTHPPALGLWEQVGRVGDGCGLYAQSGHGRERFLWGVFGAGAGGGCGERRADPAPSVLSEGDHARGVRRAGQVATAA